MDISESIRKNFILDTFITRKRMRGIFYEPYSIYINDRISINEEYLEVIIEYVSKKVKKFRSDSKIIFFLPGEGFQTETICFYDKIVRYFISNYNLKNENFYYVTASADTSYNIQRYYLFCKKFEIIPMNLVFVSSYEHNKHLYNLNDNWQLFHDTQAEQKYKIEKKFVCLNGRARLHRLAIISEILNRNLRKDCFLSFYSPDFLGENAIEEVIPYLKQAFPNVYNSIVKNWSQIYSELPIRLTLEENSQNMQCPNFSDMKMYKSSLFSLVNETFFFGLDNFKNYQQILDEQLITWGFGTIHSEKIWNCVKAKHPFILCSTPGTLRDFRELGYKTFSPFINESYDDIENNEERIIAIMAEVEKLCNMDSKTIPDWQNEVAKICEYNYNLFLERNPTVTIRIHHVGTNK